MPPGRIPISSSSSPSPLPGKAISPGAGPPSSGSPIPPLPGLPTPGPPIPPLPGLPTPGPPAPGSHWSYRLFSSQYGSTRGNQPPRPKGWIAESLFAMTPAGVLGSPAAPDPSRAVHRTLPGCSVRAFTYSATSRVPAWSPRLPRFRRGRLRVRTPAPRRLAATSDAVPRRRRSTRSWQSIILERKIP